MSNTTSEKNREKTGLHIATPVLVGGEGEEEARVGGGG
jgi:hypothetical protein